MSITATRTKVSGTFEGLTIEWRKHDSVASVVDAFFGGMGSASLADVGEIFSAGDDAEPVTLGQMMEGIEGQGFWGFCSKGGEIHYWHKDDHPRHLVAHLLGHEAGHALEGLPEIGESELADEQRADRAGLVCASVFKHMLGVDR